MMAERAILDCDNTMGKPYREVDDGLTLLYLLGRPDIEVLGITTTFGNGPIEDVYPLTQQLLRDIDRQDIPLFKGEGERGQPPTDAARFLAETIAQHPGEITVLATGPLGNLRAAAELDPSFLGNCKQIPIMGGYLHDLRLGYRKIGEINLSYDPEASFAVLNAPCPVTLMNAHVCLQAMFTWRDMRRVRHWGPKTRGLLRRWMLRLGIGCGLRGFVLWDLLPAVYIEFPELFEENPVWVRSTVQDLETGSIIVAEEGEGAQINMPNNILDRKRFKEILFDAWQKVQIG
jgi:inosine-uridine nucleoside N-ribohydrolase